MAFLDSYRPLRTAASAGAIAAPSRSAASAQQLRPVFMRTGAVVQASGSAYMECGRTKVLVAVHGPRHSTRGAAVESAERGRVWCDFKFAPFAQTQRRRRGQVRARLFLVRV
jgi:exosome complex component MTR3